MKIGILGGTFNPVHLGHIMGAKHVMQELALERILFVPVKSPVHKKLDGNITPEERLEMLKLALADELSFFVEPIELERDEPSYTIYTLKALKEKYSGAKLHLIIGADSFNSLDMWLDHGDIYEQALIVVMRRPGDEPLRDDLIHQIPGLVRVNNNLIDISSSLVRQRVRDEMSLDGFVPNSVAQYIKSKGLYLK